MTVSQASTIDQEIAQLEAEIGERDADIRKLTTALMALEANQPRPADPSADGAFALLKELVGSVPENLEQQQVYQAKLEAARTSLKLATEICQQKMTELKTLRQQKREAQETEAFEQLKVRAEEFNRRIDEALLLLDSMRLLAGAAGGKRLEVSADLVEMPYASINEAKVRIRRRFDVLQGQKG